MANFKQYVLAKDQFVKKRLQRIENISINDERWIEEIENLHVSRGIRALNVTALLESSIYNSIESNIDNQAVRSRCVELKIRALKQVTVIEELTTKLKKYILNKYGNHLKRKYSTLNERKAAVDYIVVDAEQRIDKLKFVVKLCDIVIDDCDSAGYTLMRIGNMLEQKSKDK